MFKVGDIVERFKVTPNYPNIPKGYVGRIKAVGNDQIYVDGHENGSRHFEDFRLVRARTTLELEILDLETMGYRE